MRRSKLQLRTRLRKSCSAQRKGAAIVEFALVAPLMILFSLGLVEMGRMTMVKQLITNVSREGARMATLPDANAQTIRSEVNSLLSDSNINGATVTISPATLGQAAPGSFVTVTIQVQAENVSWLPTPLFMGGKTVSAATSMRRESL